MYKIAGRPRRGREALATAGRMPALLFQLPRNRAIQVHGVAQLLLLHMFAISVGDVDRSWPDQQRLAPVAESGDVGGEGGDHRGKAVERAQSNEGNLQHEF